MNDDFPKRLAEQLAAKHPPRAARRAFEAELSYGRYDGPAPATARRAAVLALLYPDSDGWYLPLTLRPANLPSHGGQISLPGGLVEAGETTEQAALRELQEELGVAPQSVSLLGALAEMYLFVSDYLVQPWVGFTNVKPQWRPQASEVAEVIEMPWGHLIDSANHGAAQHTTRGVKFHAPHITLGQHQVWGATSLILGELIGLSEKCNICKTVVPTVSRNF